MLLDADRSTLFLFNWEAMELRTHAAQGLARELTVPLRMGIVGTALLRRELLNVTGAYSHPYFNPEIDHSLGYTTDSVLVAPMVSSDGRVLGGVQLINKAAGRFTAEDGVLLLATAARIAHWIETDTIYPAGAEAEVVDIRNRVNCDRGTVFGLEASTGRLVSIYADGGEGRPLSLNMKLGIAGTVAVTGQSLRIDDAWEDPRFDRRVDQRSGYRTRTMLCVALKNGAGQPVGVIQAINSHHGDFSSEDLAMLEAVAGVVAIAIENAMMFAEDERQFRSLLVAITAACDAAVPALAGHAVRTSGLAVALGRRLGLSAEELDVLEVTALLHDLGMLGVDTNVLHKKDKLTGNEVDAVRQHAKFTETLLQSIHFTRKYRQVPVIAASHHEALNGSGYPRGLVTAEIPFMSRILTVADAYTALVALRPHRLPLSSNAALAELEVAGSGKFDESVLVALRQHLLEAAPAEAPATTTSRDRQVA